MIALEMLTELLNMASISGKIVTELTFSEASHYLWMTSH